MAEIDKNSEFKLKELSSGATLFKRLNAEHQMQTVGGTRLNPIMKSGLRQPAIISAIVNITSIHSERVTMLVEMTIGPDDFNAFRINTTTGIRNSIIKKDNTMPRYSGARYIVTKDANNIVRNATLMIDRTVRQ